VAVHDWAHGGRPAEGDLQGQIDALKRRVAVNRADIDALAARANDSDARADDIEARAQIDRDMIAALEDEGVLNRKHAEQLEQALRSSRTIGAAIGMIMASRNVGEDEAFAILKRASQNSNRKLRELAHELVTSGGQASPVQ
jgi:tetrahydromethanopterin S-methyltransferase subunit F